MSAPISSSFSKLSLSSEMQSLRGQRRGPPSGKGKEPMQPDDDNSEEDSDFSEYEAQESEPEHALAFYQCGQIGTEDDDPDYRRYTFRIADAQIVKQGIHFKSSNTGPPICSCSEEGCRHVLWLLEQLSQAGVNNTGNVQPGYYGQIASIGLDSICEILHWKNDDAMESEQATWQLKKANRLIQRGPQTRALVQKRMDEVRDILATLSPLPLDDYRRDIFEDFENYSGDDIFVENDLYATVSRLLVLDEGFFDQFKILVPPQVRASDYFRKMEQKAMRSCRLLDEYVENGPSAGSAIHHDVIWCAQVLVDIVDAIGANVRIRRPLDGAAERAAAKALAWILTEVVTNRNTDAYQNDRFPRRRPHGESRKDTVLYQRLIEKPSPQNPPGSAFVIEHLENLPAAQLFTADLERVHGRVRTIGWGPAPQDYRDRLSDLIAHLGGGAQGSSSSSVMKRPGTSADRKANKRMK